MISVFTLISVRAILLLITLFRERVLLRGVMNLFIQLRALLLVQRINERRLLLLAISQTYLILQKEALLTIHGYGLA